MIEWRDMRRQELERNDPPLDGSKLKVGLVASDFNSDITLSMLEDAIRVLRENKVKDKNIFIVHTYGSFELPFAAQTLIRKRKLNAIVAIGCIVKGETRHDEFLAQATFQGLMRVGLDAKIPVGLGVLTVDTIEQAQARSSGATNHGGFAAKAAIRAALV